jgi:hypothetical protein
MVEERKVRVANQTETFQTQPGYFRISHMYKLDTCLCDNVASPFGLVTFLF